METLVVFAFLLLPVAGGVMVAAPTFVVAYLINSFFISYKIVPVLVNIFAITFLVFYFFDARKGELGRNVEFQIAFIIGVGICFLIYLVAYIKIKKPMKKDNKSSNGL